MPGHRLILRPMSKPGGALPARYTHCCICACPCSACCGFFSLLWGEYQLNLTTAREICDAQRAAPREADWAPRSCICDAQRAVAAGKRPKPIPGIRDGPFPLHHKFPVFALFSACKSSQVNTLPKAKSKTRSKQNKDMHKFSSVYSVRGVPLPVLTSGEE